MSQLTTDQTDGDTQFSCRPLEKFVVRKVFQFFSVGVVRSKNLGSRDGVASQHPCGYVKRLSRCIQGVRPICYGSPILGAPAGDRAVMNRPASLA